MTSLPALLIGTVAALAGYGIGYWRGLSHGEADEKERQAWLNQRRFQRDAHRIGHTILMQTTTSIALEGFARPMSFEQICGESEL